MKDPKIPVLEQIKEELLERANFAMSGMDAHKFTQQAEELEKAIQLLKDLLK